MIAVSPSYHEFTKYDPETIASQSRQLDWSQQPQPFKTYPIGHALQLKPYLATATEDTGSEQRFLQRLSRLLHLSYGVTAIVRSDRPLFLRSAPSAGGLYPAELYLLSRGTPGLPKGIYNYQAVDHSLLKYWDECDWNVLAEACFNHPMLLTGDAPETDTNVTTSTPITADVAVVVTTIFQRSAWRYEDRAYRRVCLDTGHLLGNIELSANMTGFRAAAIGEFQDEPIERLLALDEQQEGPLAILPLQDLLISPSIQRYVLESPSTGEADAEDSQPFETPSDSPKRGEWLTYLHQHTRIEASVKSGGAVDQPVIEAELPIGAERSWKACPELPGSSTSSDIQDKYNFPFCDRIETQTFPIAWGEMLQPLANTILHRRSTRQFTGGNIDIDQLRQLLDFAYQADHYRAQGLDPQPDYFDVSAIETFVVANGVDGLDDGCYYYASHAQQLRQIRFKSFRRDVHYLCLGQDLGRDAAVAIVHTADLKRAVHRHGDRGYRYLHMDAGHLGQRINLAAVRLNLGVSGIAGFFDNLVNEVLGIPPEEAVLYITTVGQPRRSAR